MDLTLDVTARNRLAWNAIAGKRPGKSVDFFIHGGSTLDDYQAAALGEVTDQRLLHLQCANGDESLSLAAQGAHVVGVDISEVAIEAANRTAEGSGLDAAFLAADVYALPPDLTGFDLVYAGAGAVCWLPDLDRWARVVAGCLRPGGRFVLYEHHPVWEALSVTAKGLAANTNYFGQRDAADRGDPAKHLDGVVSGADFQSFVWPVADVVTALIEAGLVIDRLEEYPQPSMYEGLGERADWLPGTYLVSATAGGG